jgi:P27 family predicted phage terminase small subunit
MGRPRRPTHLKALDGTTRPDRDNPAEPKPPLARPREEPPTWLSGKSRHWWRRIQPLLARMQVLTKADPVALGLLCDALADYMAARADVVANGATYTTEGKGGEMQRRRPEVDVMVEAWKRAKVMLTEFGLTPAARAKVSASDVGPADPLEEWEQGAAP